MVVRYLPAVLVFSAAGAGYLYHQEEQAAPEAKRLGKTSGLLSSWLTSSSDDSPAVDEDQAEALAAAPQDSLIAVAGPTVSDFADVFRFDLSPADIRLRWERVSAGLSDTRYQGYRVPLVTGTEPTDLAGSLTYYFDAAPRVRRITFVGSTGDPAVLVELLHKGFTFQRRKTGNARVVSYVGAGTLYKGRLHLTPAEVFSKKHQDQNYHVDLLLERN